MLANDYFIRTGLEAPSQELARAQAKLAGFIDLARSKRPPSDPTALYQYRVPKLSVDGICSLRGALESKPYELADVLGGRSGATTSRLHTLDALLAQVHQALNVDWLGVYQARRSKDAALIKLNYRGIPSRAEFPLTAAFAAKSNNSAVAMSGKARVINDVFAHLSNGGAYYECDPNVQAEACLPFFEADHVVGIIDAEHSSKSAFTSERLALLIAFCLELPALLPTGGVPVRD